MFLKRSPPCSHYAQILGVVAFTLGIYLIVEGNEFGEVLTTNAYVSGAAIFIVCGVISMIITVVGVLGAIFLWRPLLILVSTL